MRIGEFIAAFDVLEVVVDCDIMVELGGGFIPELVGSLAVTACCEPKATFT